MTNPVPSADSSISVSADLKTEARAENLPQVLGLLESVLDQTSCSLKVRMQLEVAVEEIFINIASYAYEPDTGSAEISIRIEEDPPAVLIRFADSGMPYDPLAKEDPDVTLPASERRIGGLGIFIVKKSMDEMTYRYENGQNILTLRKLF